MANSDVDLLAFADLEGEVDRIFRAYLDTQLLAFADNMDDKAAYWTEVVKFRQAKLHAPEWAPDEEADLVHPLELAKKMPSSPERGDDFVAFRYWFDVRASHWANRPQDEIHRVALQLVPAKRLEWLANQALQLQQRIDADQPRDPDAGGRPPVGAEAPPAQSGPPAHLKTILSEIKAPERKG